MKEKDLFWFSFYSLFGAWKIVGMCLDLVSERYQSFCFKKSLMKFRLYLAFEMWGREFYPVRVVMSL